eukprot:1155077-Pelagomonas_calceolata.AAC.4
MQEVLHPHSPVFCKLSSCAALGSLHPLVPIPANLTGLHSNRLSPAPLPHPLHTYKGCAASGSLHPLSPIPCTPTKAVLQECMRPAPSGKVQG